jgi:predicted nucleic acid-binding protein
MAGTRRKDLQAPQRLILDAGAVIALARGEGKAKAFLARALELMAPVEIPVVVVAETIRGGPRDAAVNRVLKAVGSVPDAREIHGRTAGHLLGAARSAATIDALWSLRPWQAEERRSSPGIATISNASLLGIPRCGFNRSERPATAEPPASDKPG